MCSTTTPQEFVMKCMACIQLLAWPYVVFPRSTVEVGSSSCFTAEFKFSEVVMKSLAASTGLLGQVYKMLRLYFFLLTISVLQTILRRRSGPHTSLGTWSPQRLGYVPGFGSLQIIPTSRRERPRRECISAVRHISKSTTRISSLPIFRGTCVSP